MVLGKFFGVLETNKNKTYIVVDTPSKSDAIKTANKFFKAKLADLNCKKVYMRNYGSNEFSFEESDGAVFAWAVSRN